MSPLKIFLITACILYEIKITVSGFDDSWGRISTYCAEDEYRCEENDECIKHAKVCDGRTDCPNGSDEESCEYKTCSGPNWFLCSDEETCLEKSYVCDGEENCPKGEDEEESRCGKPHEHRKCNKLEFTCTDKTCIPVDLVCDGKINCPDGSDEIVGCVGIEDTCNGFLCRNNRCLESHNWVCDGYDDCGDGSDESGCHYDCTVQNKKFLCSDNDTCIPLHRVCNKENDCHDGGDEGNQCTSSCEKMKCPAGCFVLPTGPQCICPSGFEYNSKSNECVDINECERNYAICSQGCKNTKGSYQCTCANKFELNSDNKTCSAKGGEPLLLYTTQKTIGGIYLTSKHQFTVAENLSQVIGVSYDGHNVFWTNIEHREECIMKAREDGSWVETIVSAGIETPEDLAVDWLTGNVYFTDNGMKHIAVCSNNGVVCTVLIVKNIDQPRGIALNPYEGIMYWSDWGVKPIIGEASMDGTNPKALVSKDIHWPNGVTLDIPNERLYWVDAKVGTIESIKLDGTDRRSIINDILKHPYGIAIMEDRIYWSDWKTKSIHSCHKFTGKHHDVVAKDSMIYDIHIYHSALQEKRNHPCIHHKCSHMCLISRDNSYLCACPDGWALGTDFHSCRRIIKKQKLYLGIGNYLIQMEHTSFGKHKIAEGIPVHMFIHKLAFNSINGSIFIADNIQKIIYELNVTTKRTEELVKGNIGNITSMSFDHLGGNLYWTDGERHTVEVVSLRNKERAIVYHFVGNDIPISLGLIPEEGKMFLALKSLEFSHIDILPMNGRGAHHHAIERKLGNDDIQVLIDSDTKTVFWLDLAGGKIEFSNFDGSQRHLFRSQLKSPSAMVAIDKDLMWSTYGTKELFYTHLSNLGSIKSIEIDMPSYVNFPPKINMLTTKPLLVVDHKCSHGNGGCSHICVALGKYSFSCLCPPLMVFKDNKNMTCIDRFDCEFRCKSGECLTMSRRCNGHRECADGSDERNCHSDITERKKEKVCAYDEFQCHDGTQCIPSSARCDQVSDCHDKSDEEHCEKFDHKIKCHEFQHACDNGRCVDLTALCDDYDDCGDNSDESSKLCDATQEKSEIFCSKGNFLCTGGTCIPKSWECDGHLDCADGSDEHDKCGSSECPKDFSKCRLGQCIDSKLICDGHNDCGDESDEINCDGEDHNSTCGDKTDSFGNPVKFQCTSDPTLCIDMKAKCNGSAECPRGEDEFGCSGCSMNEFECKETKECIHKEFRCDKQKDCSDGSDEADCHGPHNATFFYHFATMCSDDMFHCKDGTCIDQLRICDGTADCQSGEDEGPGCEKSCTQSICEQICTASPYGAICSCKKGYRLNSDRKSCSDINECKEADPCAQICENEYGSYRCSCFPDFQLRSDKMSCKSIESNPYLLFVSHDQVRKLSENPIALKILWTLNGSHITGLDVNVHRKKAYYSVYESNEFFEYDLEQGTIETINDFGLKTKIAVDWITNMVYVIDYSGRYYIKVCDFLKTKECVKLMKFSQSDVLKDIAIDAVNRFLFFSTVHSYTFSNPKTIIYRSGLDGTKREVLVKMSNYVINMEIDFYKKELFFTDSKTKILQMISYNKVSDNADRIETLIKNENHITNPSGLSIFENDAFITNIGSPEMVKCHLYGEKSCHSFNLNVHNAEDIVVVASTRQKLVKNPCEHYNCSLICVQAELGPKCICYNGEYVQPNMKCVKPSLDFSDTERSEDQSEYFGNEIGNLNWQATSNEDSGSSNGILIGFLIIFILAVVGAFGYAAYRRKHNNGNFNINMHFQNPLSNNRTSNDSDSVPVISDGSNLETRSKVYRPIQKFFQSGGLTEISLDNSTKPKDKQRLISCRNELSELAEESDAEGLPESRANFKIIPKDRTTV